MSPRRDSAGPRHGLPLSGADRIPVPIAIVAALLAVAFPLDRSGAAEARASAVRAGRIQGGLGAAEPTEERGLDDAASSSRVTPGASDDLSMFFLRGGGLVIGKADVGSVDVRTRYGLLSVPLDDVLQLRFVPRIPAELKARIEDAVGNLGNEDFDTREQATSALRKIGDPARPFLVDALRGGDEEVTSRASAILESLAEEAPEEPERAEGLEPLRGADDDEVVTKRFTIRGEVLQDRFRVTTAYGKLEVGRSDLVGVVVSMDGPISRSVDVPSTNLVPANWLDTKVSVRTGMVLRFKAAGQLHVANYNIISGPEGNTRYSGSTFEGFAMLSLVGKVGEKGKPFLIGRGTKQKITSNGRIYVGVVPFRNNYAATGAYTLKVSSGGR